MSLAVETAGLTKHYGAVAAITGLDLQVEAGQVFGYLCQRGRQDNDHQAPASSAEADQGPGEGPRA